MIYRELTAAYGSIVAEGIILEAMSLLGRLPESNFVFREQETCPRVSCAHSLIWFSYLEELDKVSQDLSVGDEEIDDSFTVHLLSEEKFDFIELSTSSLEEIAREVERHERTMRSSQARLFAEDQLSTDSSSRRRRRKLC